MPEAKQASVRVCLARARSDPLVGGKADQNAGVAGRNDLGDGRLPGQGAGAGRFLRRRGRSMEGRGPEVSDLMLVCESPRQSRTANFMPIQGLAAQCEIS